MRTRNIKRVPGLNTEENEVLNKEVKQDER